VNNVVTIPWEGTNNQLWSETCAVICEHFGLPGGKYTTKLNPESMDIIFHNEKDALMCKMLVSDKI
jgi:hypothetical protein